MVLPEKELLGVRRVFVLFKLEMLIEWLLLEKFEFEEMEEEVVLLVMAFVVFVVAVFVDRCCIISFTFGRINMPFVQGITLCLIEIKKNNKQKICFRFEM